MGISNIYAKKQQGICVVPKLIKYHFVQLIPFLRLFHHQLCGFLLLGLQLCQLLLQDHLVFFQRLLNISHVMWLCSISSRVSSLLVRVERVRWCWCSLALFSSALQLVHNHARTLCF